MLQSIGNSEPSTLRPPAVGRLPMLDGLRGIAILLVLYCHGTIIERSGVFANLMHAAAQVSWVGVDLFFVLSGFLITGILFDSKGRSGYFINFYARRTLRIFPLYYAVLVLFFIVIPRLSPHLADRFEMPPDQPIWYWLYLSNLYQAFNVQTHVLDVSWSLAIEEQFYLVWPMVVALMGRRALMTTCIVLFGTALLLRGVLHAYNADFWLAAMLTPCRLDALAVGAWIALYIRGSGSRKHLLRGALWVGPLAAISVTVLLGATYLRGYRSGIVTSWTYGVFGFSLFALAFGSLLVAALAIQPTSVLGRLLSNRVLLWFGQYSYAIYLLHEPIMILAADHLWGPNRSALGFEFTLAGQIIFYVTTFAASLGVGWLSWHLFEKHFLALKRFFPAPQTATAASAWQSATNEPRPEAEPAPAAGQRG